MNRNKKKGRNRRIQMESNLESEERGREREGVIEHKGSQVRGKTEGEIGKVSAAERGYQRNTTGHHRPWQLSLIHI